MANNILIEARDRLKGPVVRLPKKNIAGWWKLLWKLAVAACGATQIPHGENGERV